MGGLIDIEKHFRDGKPVTTFHLTSDDDGGLTSMPRRCWLRLASQAERNVVCRRVCHRCAGRRLVD